MSARGAAVCWLLLGCAPATALAQAPAAGCDQAISEANAKAVFARFAALGGGDGCKLASVNTARVQVRVRFEKGQTALPELVLVGKRCAREGDVAGKMFAYTPRPELAAACPATEQAVRAAVLAEDFGGASVPTSTPPDAPEAPGKGRWVALGACLLLVAGAVLYGQRRAGAAAR